MIGKTFISFEVNYYLETTKMTPQEPTPTALTGDQVVRNIEHHNKVECYKAELIEQIELGMFYTARTLINKCIKEISDYRAELEDDLRV
jgi:hypothetical protein